MDSATRPQKLPQTFKYAFNGGEEFAYAFSMRIAGRGKVSPDQVVAGIAVFQATKNSGGRWEVLARDNIQPLPPSGTLRPTPRGQKTMMLNRAINVDGDGDEPRLDGDLPALLGSIEDWFFPPIPPMLQVKGGRRGVGTPVVRTDTGRWRDVGFYNPNDEGARGYYEWEVTPVENRDGLLKVEDKRTFRNRIGSIELVGRGTFRFDVQRGILRSRSFQASFTEGDEATTITIEFVATEPSKLAQ
jgi:hypothetical protein